MDQQIPVMTSRKPRQRAIGEKIPVLFVNTATRPPLGADTWVHGQIMRSLDRSTHIVYAACAPGPIDEPTPTFQLLRTIPDLQLRPVNFGPELYGRSRRAKVRALIDAAGAIPGFLAFARFARRTRVAVVHTSDRPRDAVACILLARAAGAKCIIQVHVGYGDWMSPLLRWALKRADALIAVSAYVEQTLVEGGLDAARIHVVLNAIDPDGWTPDDGRDEVRRELRLPPDAPVVITVCRLFPEKGPGDLIAVLPELRQQYPDVRLVVVGDEFIPGYRSQLEQTARHLGVADNVVFTGRRSDVPRLMAAADVYAMPSLGEPFGLVFLEAMAMRLPVVAVSSGGAPEIIEHGVTGLLSPPGDRAQLQRHLGELLSDRDRRIEMGTAGRRRVEDRFTLPRMAADTAEVYKRVTDRNRNNRIEEREGRP